jgi:prolyl 4-hydroxylase
MKQKIKAPKELFALIKDFWDKNRDKSEVEWSQINTYHNMWDSPPTIVHMNQHRMGGSPELQAKIFDMMKEVMEEWTGQILSPVSLYGIRSYHDGSILAPHVDRMPLVSSAISKCLWSRRS